MNRSVLIRPPREGSARLTPCTVPMVLRRALVVLTAYCTVALLSVALAYQQSLVLPNGQSAIIDWDSGQLMATGQAVPPSNAVSPGQRQLLARRGAILDGQRNLLESMAGVHVTSETTMVNLMANDVVRSGVQGVVAGAVVTSELWDPTSEIYTVEMEIPLSGLREAALHDKVIAMPFKPTAEVPTGLIIDVGGLGAVPSLTFRVLTLEGFEVTAVGQAFYVVTSSAGYAAALEQAKVDIRVADAPLVIRAVALGGNGIDILISESDGALLAGFLGEADLFGNGRTLVLMY